MYNLAQGQMGYFCDRDERVMNLFLRKILLSCFCSLVMIFAKGQADISLSISPAQVDKDEYATLKIIITNATDVNRVTPPSLTKFTVLSGPKQEFGNIRMNGQQLSYVAIVYTVKPKTTGRIAIEPALVQIGRQSYKTNATALQVNNAVSTNSAGSLYPGSRERPLSAFSDYIFRKGDNIADKVNKNMIMRLEVNKTSCYVGEPVIATYKLYTRLKSESKLSENPSFNGFSVIDLTSHDISAYTREKLNGREYNVYTIRKAQLYPLQSGSIALEPAVLENNIQFIKDEYLDKHRNNLTGLFDDFTEASVPAEGVINQSVSLTNKPVTIEVKALPELSKPASFAGAVGKFNMEAVLEKTIFPSNEPGKLLLRISGSGNLQLMTAPTLLWPAGIEPFDPKVAENLDKTMVPVNGNKTFEYSFSANTPGDYMLPAISFSYFDAGTASYKTIGTKPLPFTVTKATGPVVLANRPVNSKTAVTGINRIFNNRWWIIVFLAIVMLSGMLIWVRNERRVAEKHTIPVLLNEEQLKLNSIIETSAINQQNPLEKTEACLFRDDCISFYSLLNVELKSYLSKKFAVEPININTGTVAAIMDKQNISNDTVLQLQQLLKQIEWQLYTPFERNDKMNAMYQEAQDILQMINTYSIRNL
ncbi:BatD family protein [soil metagenome]